MKGVVFYDKEKTMMRRLSSLVMGAVLALASAAAMATGPPEKFVRPAFVVPGMAGDELYTQAPNRHETYVLRFELGPSREVRLTVLDGPGGPSHISLTVAAPPDDLRVFAIDHAGPFKVGWHDPSGI